MEQGKRWNKGKDRTREKMEQGKRWNRVNRQKTGNDLMCLKDKNVEKDSSHFEGSVPELALIDGRYKVEWVNLGEGKDGDYDPSDPSDVPLLRFDISFDGELMQDGSYCTLLPVDTPENILRKGLERIMDTIKDECGSESHPGSCSRKVFEELSWIGPKWFQELECTEEKKEHVG